MLLLPRLGARVLLCGPREFLPDLATGAGPGIPPQRQGPVAGDPGIPPQRQGPVAGDPGIAIERDFEAALKESQAVMMLRIQAERLAGVQIDLEQYKASYQLTGNRLHDLAPQAVVLHPGPIIRGLEITAGVADGAQSAILEQVRNGVAIRMAVVERALTAAPRDGGRP
jgi:aspartate carbamoyltransferase catalytic subunit